MPTENRSSNTGMPFKREDRYIVIKRSDLANVPVNYRSALVSPMLSLLSHLPRRECLIIESDWPEYEPTWAAIEARVTGKPEVRHQGSGQFNDEDRYLLCREELQECEEERVALSDEVRELRAQLTNLQSSVREFLRVDGISVDGSAARNKALKMLAATLSASAEPSAPVEIDERAVTNAFHDWAFYKKGEAIGRMDGQQAALEGFIAGADWQARAALERKPS